MEQSPDEFPRPYLSVWQNRVIHVCHEDPLHPANRILLSSGDDEPSIFMEWLKVEVMMDHVIITAIGWRMRKNGEPGKSRATITLVPADLPDEVLARIGMHFTLSPD